METLGTSPRSADKVQGDSSFRMIDVGEKQPTRRRALAEGKVLMARETAERVRRGELPKGDVLALAEAAGIMAAKRTSDLLPLCHPLPLDAVAVKCEMDPAGDGVIARCEAVASAKTGVEMEALTGVSAALLCIYDLVKGIDPALSISGIHLKVKEGGKSGRWVHPLYGEGEVAAPSQARSNGESEWKGLRIGVVTISDRCSRGEAEDRSGPVLENTLRAKGVASVERRLVPDDVERIRGAVLELARELRCQVVFTTGGTGLGPRDVTPEALRPLWTRSVPGLAEMLRARGAAKTPHAWLSRGEAGLIGNSLVVLFPGSARAVAEGLEELEELVPHALHVLGGGGRS